MPMPWEQDYPAAGGGQPGFTPVTPGDPMKPLQVQKAQGDVAVIPYDIQLKRAQAAEAEAKARKESGQPAPITPQQRADKLFQNDETLATIRQAIELARAGKGTGFGSMFSSVPTSNAKLLSNYIKTIRANLTIDNMMAMKNASSTGATGFGSLSEKEGETLSSTVSALDQSMSSDQLVEALNKADNHYRRFRASIEGIDPSKVRFDIGQAPGIGTKQDRRKQQVIGPGSSSAPPGRGGPGGPLAGPDDPLAPTALGLGSGKTNVQIDPALEGVRRRVAGMVSSGAPATAIRSYLKGVGVNPASVNGIDAAVAFRKRNPGYLGSFPVDIGVRDLPMSRTRQTMATLANSPFGAAGVAAGNAASLGGLDEIVGMTGGNAALANAGKQGLAAQYPKASMAGNIIGGVGAAAGIEAGLARAGLAGGGGMIAPRALGADAVYGGGFGAGENNDDRLGGAILGAGTAVPGGIGGRALAAGAGRLATGVTNANVRTLNSAGVPMTLGQLAGRGAKSIEDKMTSLPLVGGLINARRAEGLKGFNAAVFKEAAAPLGAQATGNIGEAGVEDLADTVTGGYKKALGTVQLNIDPKFGFDLGNAAVKIQHIPRVGGELHDTLSGVLPTYFDNGALTGDNLQAVLDHVRQIKASYKNDPLYGARIKPALDDLHDSITGMVERQAPDVMPAFRAADKAYKNRKIVGNAVKAAMNTDGVFTPAQLGQQARAAANKFGNNADTTNRPFFDLQRSGQNILPSKVGDSGTAGRMMLPLALSGAGGVAGGVRGYAGSDGNNAGADTASGIGGGMLSGGILAALLSAPGTRMGQQAIQSVLTAPRPQPVVNIGQLVRDQAKLGGFVGAPLALQYQNFGN